MKPPIPLPMVCFQTGVPGRSPIRLQDCLVFNLEGNDVNFLFGDSFSECPGLCDLSLLV